MGIAAWIVWRSAFEQRQLPIAIYAIQLPLNLGCSVL
ncbi:MAG: tryptophan-rich sensory protein [Desulfomonilaceae bacterium]